jgi:hypothetical protein
MADQEYPITRVEDGPPPSALPPPRRSGAGGCVTASGLLLLAGGVLLLLGAVALFLAVDKGRQLVETVSAPFSGPTPTANILTATVIIQRLRGASDLTTAVSTVETIVDASQDRTFGPFSIGRTRLLYLAHGDVRAGVDLSELGASDVRVSEATNSVHITLPRPRILDKKVDVTRSRVYDVDESLLAPAAPELQTLAERQALDKILQAACEGGILEEANQRAKLAVEALVAGASPYTVEVSTQAPLADACPAASTATPGVLP